MHFTCRNIIVYSRAWIPGCAFTVFSSVSKHIIPHPRETPTAVITHLKHSYRVGCAYYDPTKFVIYILEDTAESSHFDTTKLCGFSYHVFYLTQYQTLWSSAGTDKPRCNTNKHKSRRGLYWHNPRLQYIQSAWYIFISLHVRYSGRFSRRFPNSTSKGLHSN